MVYFAVFTTLLSFILCCVATVKLYRFRPEKHYYECKLVVLPMAPAGAGVMVVAIGVWYGLSYETALGAILIGLGDLLGLLVSLQQMMAERKDRRRTVSILSGFRRPSALSGFRRTTASPIFWAMGLYGASLFFALVQLLVGGVLV